MRTTINNTTVNITARQMELIATLTAAHHGFASIHGYVSDTKRVKPETADFVIQSKFSTQKVRDNNVEALKSIAFADLDEDALEAWIPSKGKNAFADAFAQFRFCMDAMIASIEKTNEGDRSDGHRQGHDENYLRVCKGVKIHYVTDFVEVDGKKVKRPVLDADGIPTVNSIMLEGLVFAKRIVEKGEYKKVNSGSKVLMDNMIRAVWNKRKNDIRTFVLTDDKFESVKIGGEWIDSQRDKDYPTDDE